MNITIENGTVNYGDVTAFERNVVEGTANYFGLIEPYDRQKWIALAEWTLKEMRDHSEQLVAQIKSDYKVFLHTRSTHQAPAKLMDGEDQKAYVNGYSDAVEECKGVFDRLDAHLDRVLDKFIKTKTK